MTNSDHSPRTRSTRLTIALASLVVLLFGLSILLEPNTGSRADGELPVGRPRDTPRSAGDLAGIPDSGDREATGHSSTVPTHGQAEPTPRLNRSFGIAAGALLNAHEPSEIERRAAVSAHDRLAADLDLMTDLGVGWVRIDVAWDTIELSPGVYDWRRTDRSIAAARARGLRVLALVAYTPDWARPVGATSDKVPPADPAAFGAFAGAAAERYEPAGVDHWEIWNEPNLARFFGPTPDAAAYGELLRFGASGIRGANPRAQVIAGGLAPGADTFEQISPVAFVEQLYALGHADAFDALAAHPYTYPSSPADQGSGASTAFVDLDRLRDLLEANGDGHKRIWITEYGVPTGDSARAVGEREQAEHLAQAIEIGGRKPWLGPLFFYNHRDGWDDPSDPEANFGLARVDGTKKPAYDHLRRLLTAPSVSSPR